MKSIAQNSLFPGAPLPSFQLPCGTSWTHAGQEEQKGGVGGEEGRERVRGGQGIGGLGGGRENGEGGEKLCEHEV